MHVMRLVIALIILILATSSAWAGKRVALVIGNSNYLHTHVLDNPKNDALDIAAALKATGFQVIVGLDLDKVTFDQRIREFSIVLTDAEAGVFFYSGHGLQVAGKNYLVPIDAELKTANALEFDMISLDFVQRTMERQASTNIIFLDACRDNPFERLGRVLGTRSGGAARGLAPVESGLGTLISFSTQPGNVALDGKGRNSPFSGSLAPLIQPPPGGVLAGMAQRIELA
jgi:uncharacterized caspase-like protein